jgi:hypothetical protein
MFPLGKTNATSRRFRDSGHLLLAILLMMALMIIAAMYEAPRVVQQMKRDREAEMIHRGTEYARGIKKFYKKFGRYPTTLEQLDNTNNIRFIRKRYKDPLSKDGKWTLLHYGDIAMLLNANAPGISAASLASGGAAQGGAPGVALPAGTQPGASSSFGNTAMTSGGFGTSNFGSNPQASGQGGMFNQQPNQSGLTQPNSGPGSLGSPGGQGTTSGLGSVTTGNTGTSGSDQTAGTSSNSAALSAQGSQSLTGQVFGAGAIVGVASTSKDPTIRIYNKKKTYDEWQFIYSPQTDQQNVLLRGPYSPSILISNTNIGTPAGQLNQQGQGQQSPFGQQGGGYGNQQQSGSGTQQPITPGGQFPPDQNH